LVAVASAFFNWQEWGVHPSGSGFTTRSPNLRLIEAFVKERWDFDHAGDLVVRPVVGGTKWSDHAYGAAIDEAWGHWVVGGQEGSLASAREKLLTEVLPFLIAHSQELGIQALHDYWCRGEPHETRDDGTVWPIIDAATGLPKCGGGRVWRSWRPSGGGWKDQQVKPGDKSYQFHRPGNRWIHIGTGSADWGKATSIAVRLATIDRDVEGDDDMSANMFIQERVTATGQLANAIWEFMPHAGRKRCVTLTATMHAQTKALYTERGWSTAVKQVATADMPIFGFVDGPVPQRPGGGAAYDNWGCQKT
jgi:hypothetical protein